MQLTEKHIKERHGQISCQQTDNVFRRKSQWGRKRQDNFLLGSVIMMAVRGNRFYHSFIYMKGNGYQRSWRSPVNPGFESSMYYVQNKPVILCLSLYGIPFFKKNMTFSFLLAVAKTIKCAMKRNNGMPGLVWETTLWKTPPIKKEWYNLEYMILRIFIFLH